MKKASIYILSSVFIVFSLLFLAYNYMPLSWLGEPEQRVGATITTINGTDTLKDSRSVINTNFSNLNTSKLEKTEYFSTTTHPLLASLPSLSLIGTIISGIWHGSIIDVLYGGTGWGYIAPNTVLYGNGNGKLATTTAGSNGQFLSLTGGVPTWATSSIDQSANYSWSGSSTFSGLTLFTSTTTINNGVIPSPTSSTSPVSLGYASSTYGNISLVAASSTVVWNSAGYSTTTLYYIPAGKMGTRKGFRIKLSGNMTQFGGTSNVKIMLNNTDITNFAPSGTSKYSIESTLLNLNSASSQATHYTINKNTSTYFDTDFVATSFNTVSTDLTLSIVLYNSSANYLTLNGYTVEFLNY